jgi:hypothetical protein
LTEAGQEPFKLLHIAIDRGAELRIEPVTPADFVESLRASADVYAP